MRVGSQRSGLRCVSPPGSDLSAFPGDNRLWLENWRELNAQWHFWGTFFGPMPSRLVIDCCGQFVATREAIRRFSKMQYQVSILQLIFIIEAFLLQVSYLVLLHIQCVLMILKLVHAITTCASARHSLCTLPNHSKAHSLKFCRRCLTIFTSCLHPQISVNNQTSLDQDCRRTSTHLSKSLILSSM